MFFLGIFYTRDTSESAFIQKVTHYLVLHYLQSRKLFAQICRVIMTLAAYTDMKPNLPHCTRLPLTLSEGLSVHSEVLLLILLGV